MIPLLTIPGKPGSHKNQWTVGRGRDGKPCIRVGDKAKAWKAGAAAVLKYQWRPRKPLEGPVGAMILVCQGRAQACDLDNALGGVFDALQAAGVLKNDYQIEALWAERTRDAERPRIEIQLFEKGETHG
jgi:Holliday junction resolvase RusA-like endonuclease